MFCDTLDLCIILVFCIIAPIAASEQWKFSQCTRPVLLRTVPSKKVSAFQVVKLFPVRHVLTSHICRTAKYLIFVYRITLHKRIQQLDFVCMEDCAPVVQSQAAYLYSHQVCWPLDSKA